MSSNFDLEWIALKKKLAEEERKEMQEAFERFPQVKRMGYGLHDL